jgi:hypothetical protein
MVFDSEIYWYILKKKLLKYKKTYWESHNFSVVPLSFQMNNLLLWPAICRDEFY